MTREPLWRRYLRLFGPDVAADVDDEIDFHLAALEDRFRARGMSEPEAREAARLSFGDVESVRRQLTRRDDRRLRRVAHGQTWSQWMHDLRYAFRTLRRSPLFSLIAILTLTLGIGATTAIFSVINGVLLRPLPYPDAERIVRVFEVSERGGRMNFSDPDFEDLRDQSHSFASLAQASGQFVVPVVGTSEAVRANAAMVSRAFFPTLGVTPIEGRLFAPEELQPGGRPAVVVSEGFWKSALGSAPLGPGLTLHLEDKVYAVVGVMPASLDYPAQNDVWIPREVEERNPYRTAHNWQVLGRLTPGASVAQARTDIGAIARRLKEQYGSDSDMTDATLLPLREQLVGYLKSTLFILLGAAGFLLLIACANVINLMLARMAAREGELALRLSLGATRTRLARQFMAEALMLAGSSAVLGVLLAGIGTRALLELQQGRLPRTGEVHTSVTVLGFALVVSLLSALSMGLVTAWRVARGSLRDALAESQRTQAGGGLRIRRVLVIAQVAATLVLLVGAGLLGRSFLRLLSVDPGFRTEDVLVLEVAPSTRGPSAQRETARFYDELMARLAQVPGVREVGGANVLPLDGTSAGNGTFLLLDNPANLPPLPELSSMFHDPTRTGQAEYRIASGGYFRAMNIPLLRGRLFDDRDQPDAAHVAVISQSLAAQRWPDTDPIGKAIEFGNMDGDMRPFTIVGIVGDVREATLDATPKPTVYASYRQRPVKATPFSFVLHGSSVESAATMAAARRAVRDLRPDLPPRIHSIETVVSSSVADRRFTLLLIGIYGASALVLAGLGVYGVIAYLVRQRRQEIGVRIALGAQTGDVLKLVLRQGVFLGLAGVAIGAVAAMGLTRLIAGLLYDISPTDPTAFGVVSLGLVGVVLLASLVPARRAAQVDPMIAMRME